MVRFEDLQLFVRTAALGSLSNVAREGGLLPGQVAAAVKRLDVMWMFVDLLVPRAACA